ncbi:MAG: beta-N-acetylhexosaminidase [Bryobacteraceae bacterium]|nr:beta-N-acetylhexosaminidase [Bryobacteraceae bacterium]
MLVTLLAAGGCSRQPSGSPGAESTAAAIIPKPVAVESRSGTFEFNRDTKIVAQPAAASEARLLAGALRVATGFPFDVVEADKGAENAVFLGLDPALTRLGTEGYILEVTPRQVTIQAPTAAGAFYGAQSLRQLLPAAAFSSTPQEGAAWSVACVRIEDYPRFQWRGALLDVARHFMPKETVLKFIDALAIQKMNRLQLHLTDDQGWRIEIKKYPKLTEIGSKRKETRVGLENEKRGFDGKPHGGFYSQADIREMVKYAEERHVTLVPEIEMPGHAQAAIAAYPELGNTGEKLEVSTMWGVHKNVFNANESTIKFLQDVLTEVLDLFPSQFIHVGGDEVPLDQWKASKQAQARMKELGLKEEVQLHGYIIRRMDDFLRSKGRRLVGWDEILEGGVDQTAVVMSWRGSKGGITAAKAGHDVIMAPNTHTYFDYYQAKGPDEPLAIGGFVPLEMVYGFDPIPSEFSPAEAGRILGAQGQLWTEYIATQDYLEYMAFPRLTALAEVAWTPAERKDYQDFTARLREHEKRLDNLGVKYRPSAGR